jgi:hypothetical protein
MSAVQALLYCLGLDQLGRRENRRYNHEPLYYNEWLDFRVTCHANRAYVPTTNLYIKASQGPPTQSSVAPVITLKHADIRRSLDTDVFSYSTTIRSPRHVRGEQGLVQECSYCSDGENNC